MRKHTPKPIALAVADIHLQHIPPRCRAGEGDWYAAMKRVFDEVIEVADKIGSENILPILCAGDVFNYWKASPELINFALNYLPRLWSIPGQHDLPQHNYEERRKSAYDTLALGGVIEDLSPHFPHHIIGSNVHVWAFPWGFPVKAPEKFKCKYNIALVHEYNWMPGHSYPNAPKEKHITPRRKELAKFDLVIFGDNHKGFQTTIGRTNVWNCGTLMRRAVDEADYRPRVGIIYDDMTVKPHYLDTTKDVMDLNVKDVIDETMGLEIKDFLKELDGLTQNPFDFREVLERYITDNKVSDETKKVLIESMEGAL